MKNLLIAFIIICATGSLGGCTKGGDQLSLTGAVYTVSSAADGAQLVPANAVTSTGSLTGIFDEQANVFTFTLSWTNLWTTAAPDAITGIKFYSPAAKGANGTLTHTISFSNSTSATGTINLGLGGNIGFTASEKNDLYAGTAYFIIMTTKYPNGIIRGQLTATKQ
ncbi:MAG: CHRD domain-containing protein [Bacteroidota bacterium]